MRKLWSFLIAFSLVTLAGCSKDDENADGALGGSAYVAIDLVNGGIPSRAPDGTKPATADEKKVTVLEFYIFDATGNTADELVYNEGSTDKGYYKIAGDNLAAAGKKHTMRVSAGVNKKMVVVANMNLGPLTATMKDYTTVQAALSVVALSNSNSRQIPATGLTMSGVAGNSEITPGNTTGISVGMTRLVSKILQPDVASATITLDQEEIKEAWGDDTDITTADAIGFELIGYAVINGIDKSNTRFMGRADGNYKAPGTNAWSDWDTYSKETYAKSHASNNSTFTGNDYASNYSGKQGNEWFLTTEEPVFIYESKPGKKEMGFDPKQVAALIIEGKLTARAQETTRYWRINLTKTDFYHIMRNCVYEISVTSIVTPGHDTPKDAEDEVSVIPNPDESLVDFVVNVAEWDLNMYATQM